jgi:subtilisin family serine protease
MSRSRTTLVADVQARISIAASAALAALVAASTPALGADLHNAPAPPGVSLPGDAGIASAAIDRSSWIVATRAGGSALARAHGGERIAGRAFLVPRGRARALAAALRSRGLLDYAEPNRLAERAQAPAQDDPLTPFTWWRASVVGDAVPPAVTSSSPLIAVVDTRIDETHPEIAGSGIKAAPGGQVKDFHGTATTTVAAAPANGVGFLGVWPGARALNLPLADGADISCAESARGIARAIRAGADVLNMSYGSVQRCTTEEHQILRAVKARAVPVAAAGNEFQQGNPLEFPASLAHVITVAAIAQDDRPTGFSSESGAVDLSAPGVGILTAVPTAFDPDGVEDGYFTAAGTSFSAPMVSAAVAWIRAARPELTPFQAAQVVRLGARDIGEEGYESATGFGALSVPGALARRPPANDPKEPNDDVRYVDGRTFGSPARAFFRGRSRRVVATADYAEDPVDVYRLRLRPGRRVRLTLNPSVGDPDLFVFGPRTRSVRAGRSLDSSSRAGGAIDRLAIRNRGRRTRTYYAAVGFDSTKDVELYNTSYELRARP